MISIPIFERLSVKRFALYPGSDPDQPGLWLKFSPGLTLIIGANGLGKTTLITILYRMITGPFDIPALSSRLFLGDANIEAKSLSNTLRDQLRTRVSDGAKDAEATLVMRIGRATLTITRSLRDLSLLGFKIGSASVGGGEAAYQDAIVSRVGVGTFSDVILILRHMVFLFEDRRTLVWDPGAQKQLLRLLFLPTDLSLEWTKREREVLELDSQARNLRAVISAQQKQLSADEAAFQTMADVRAELSTLEEYRDRDSIMRDDLLDKREHADDVRKQARLRRVQDEAARDSRMRELEHASLDAVSARFPATSTSTLYLLTQLMSDGTCRVCEHDVPKLAVELNARVSNHHCLVCDSVLPRRRGRGTTVLADKQLERARDALRTLDVQLRSSAAELNAAETQFTAIHEQLLTLETTMATRESRINDLIRRLPPDEQGFHDRKTRIGALRSVERESFETLDRLRRDFSHFVDRVSHLINDRAADIASSFNSYARDFLVESCTLLWAPQRSSVGQTGERIEFPAFQLELSGADFAIATRRVGPEQVSESQREFIDIAFRMALIEVSGSGKGGTLVVDAPESSLDAVFTTRAAHVFGAFARARPNNRLLLTSNLVEGSLIPRLVREAGRNNGERHVVNLLDEAEPTGAVREHLAEYKAAYRRLTRSTPARANASKRGHRG